MKISAVLLADLAVSPLGTRSRLADELVGIPVLRRTIDRVRLAQRVDDIYVLCPADQQNRCTSLLQGTPAIVRAFDRPPAPWTRLVMAARKWSLDGWRGGIGGATSYDEYTDGRALVEVAIHAKADAVLCVSPSAVLLDPVLTDAMIEQKKRTSEDVHLTFCQGPPGLTGLLLDVATIREVAEKNIPVGWIFGYQPDHPRKDLIFVDCCCEIPDPLRYAVGRMMADTDRSMARLHDLLRKDESPDAETIGRWLLDREQTSAEILPREVEIELTTQDGFPNTLLRPRGTRVPQRGPIDIGMVRDVIGELLDFDDSLVVLGGFGDPLLHPRFADVLAAIRKAEGKERRLFGLAVRTSGVELSDSSIRAIMEHDVDVLNVTLDAWSADLYGKLQSPEDPSKACLDFVGQRIDRVGELCREIGQPIPIVLPEMTKSRDNLDELDAFHDGWLRRTGTVAISGYSHFAGCLEDRAAVRMAPASRTPCRRIRSRCVVLADGSVTMCDQDVRGEHTLGRLGESSLGELWRGTAFERIRKAHRAGDFAVSSLCTKCDDWHRP